MDVYVKRKDKQANLCEGCLGKKDLLNGPEEAPLRPAQIKRDTGYEMISINSRQSLLAESFK